MSRLPGLAPSHLLRHNPEELFYIAAEPLRTPALAFRRYRLKVLGEQPVGYIGWLGHRNLGDEVMFRAIRKAFARLAITQFLPVPGEKLLAGLGCGGPGFFRAVLLGGGTLINPLYLEAAQLVKRFHAPLFTLGTGVGSPGFGMPLHSPLDGWKDILRSSASVSVRGPLSLRLLEDEGIEGATVIGDPALRLTPDNAPPFRTRNRLIINLAQEHGTEHLKGEYSVFNEAGEIARKVIHNGGEVVGVALGTGDHAILASFRAAHKLSGMRIETHRASGEALLRTLVGSVGMIGVRLHSAVLAACVGVPPILFAYREKCEDFMTSMELSDFAVPLSAPTSGKALSDAWTRVLDDSELGSRIYRKALFWKHKQHTYYNQVAKQILNS